MKVGSLPSGASAGEEECEYLKSGIVEEFEFSDEEDETPQASPPAAEAAEAEPQAKLERHTSQRCSFTSDYSKISAEDAEQVIAGDSGMVWHAQIYPDTFSDPKHTLASGELKPRRPLPQARASEFFKALVRTSDGRWIFGGVLNGWPALTNLELRSITGKGRDKLTRLKGIKRFFEAGAKDEGHVPTSAEQLAEFHQAVLKKYSVRVTLRAPSWTGRGFAADEPGHVIWFDSQRKEGPPRVLHGTGILAALRAAPEARMVNVHLFGHRYASVRESVKDRLTYHAALLLEWDHGCHCSVIELAWLNGLGGYGGKSNFVADRDSPRPALYHAFPAGMKAPWVPSRSEVRVLDVPARNVAEFQAYLQEFTGPKKRFMEPNVSQSAKVALSYRSQADLFRYLINYMARNPRYVQESRNCQTFTADLFRFLSGRQNVEPYHPVIRPFYKPRTVDFLYETEGFE